VRREVKDNRGLVGQEKAPGDLREGEGWRGEMLFPSLDCEAVGEMPGRKVGRWTKEEGLSEGSRDLVPVATGRGGRAALWHPPLKGAPSRVNLKFNMELKEPNGVKEDWQLIDT